MKYEKILLNIPHSNTIIPNKVGIINDEELNETINVLTDWHTDELFSFVNERVKSFIFPYSRCWCDVERYKLDIDEPMSKKGMGVIYTHGVNGVKFKDIDLVESLDKEFILECYDKHHNDIINNIVDKTLILDCHSFLPKKFKNDGLESDVNEFPHFCLGYNKDDENSYNTLLLIKEFLENKGFSVGINNPYVGSLTYPINKNLDSIMIEVNKELYLDDYNIKRCDFYKTKYTIVSIINYLLSL